MDGPITCIYCMVDDILKALEHNGEPQHQT